MSLVAAADIRCHALLNEIYCERKVGVEIGVYRGDLSWRLLGSNRNIFLYLVDPWEECAPDSSYATTEDHINRCTQAEHDESMRQAMNNVDLFRGQFKVLRMTSEEAAKEFPDESIDFVFIDGDHSYEGCSQDIALWYPKLKDGGLLSGHDYRDGRNYGVKQAVHEFAKQAGKEFRTGENYTWFVTK
jgi:hypothetical protein